MKTIAVASQRGVGEDAAAVIRQARRRQRRRQLVTGVAVVLAFAGALGGYAAAVGTGHQDPARAVGDSANRPVPGPGAIGVNARVLMWPLYPAFGPGSGPPAYLDNLATGVLAQQQVPGIVGCDCQPYLIGVGHQLVYVGEKGTMAIAADLAGKPRVLGATQFFAPSAAPGRVWLIYSRKGAHIVRSVPVVGGRPGRAITLPSGTWLTGGTDKGLLLERLSGILQVWNPGEAPKALPYSANWSDTFAASARIVVYGTGCENAITGSSTPDHERIGYNSCQELRVFDVITGRVDSFRTPAGTAGWVQSGIYGIGMDNAISPRNTMIAAEAVTSPRQGQTRLFVLRLAGAHSTATPVPSSAAFMTAMTTWSADGSWLFYQGPGEQLWAYQAATGKARRSLAPCCQYNAMIAIPSS
jgi:hypothetical protein